MMPKSIKTNRVSKFVVELRPKVKVFRTRPDLRVGFFYESGFATLLSRNFFFLCIDLHESRCALRRTTWQCRVKFAGLLWVPDHVSWCCSFKQTRSMYCSLGDFSIVYKSVKYINFFILRLT